MSYPVWPESLPMPRRDDFSVTGAQPVRRIQMESGMDRVTRISSTTVREATHVIVVSSMQAADFWSFYENEANGGADFVLIPTLTGNAVRMHRCRFASYPSMVPDGLEWRISFTLETAEQHIDWSV